MIKILLWEFSCEKNYCVSHEREREIVASRVCPELLKGIHILAIWLVYEKPTSIIVLPNSNAMSSDISMFRQRMYMKFSAWFFNSWYLYLHWKCCTESEKAQLVCGTCRKLCLYPRGAKWIRCPGCQEVNFSLEGNIHFLQKRITSTQRFVMSM